MDNRIPRINFSSSRYVAVPLAPESSQLHLVLGNRFPVHASGQLGPFHAFCFIARLTGFDRFDIVRCSETSWAMKGKKVVQPAGEELAFFFSRSQLPSCY